MLGGFKERYGKPSAVRFMKNTGQMCCEGTRSLMPLSRELDDDDPYYVAGLI